ncbi:hypothetical protein like AT1G68350 [Hibiscus trionum]|uniref:Uncharacterized protein n=1 Tax=Hibiscus trionum TaxID=183268 RepID=A0A9W7HDZ1_HIBTR|nr:hypothetical protein like AT1G68350 [Hibiscus trionum]
MKTSLKRFPILRRLVSKSNNLLPISIHKLVFLKKSRRMKRFKLLKHYNYGFLGEYQFDSPSSTPLIHYYNPKHELGTTSIRDIYSMLFWCKCFGSLKDEAREEADQLQPAPMALPILAVEMEEEEGDEDSDSVDERAERFIENFYAQMRLQRQESF